MNKKLLLVAALLCTTVTFAQTKPPKKRDDDKKFRFGFKGAMTTSWIKSDDKKITKDGIPVGFSYGFNVDYKLAKNFSFVTGFDVTNINMKMKNIHPNQDFTMISSTKYDSLGKRLTTTKTSSTTLLNITAKYIEVPILFNGHTNEIGYWTYFIQGGFSPSVLVSQKATLTSSDTSFPELLAQGEVKLNATESLDEYRSTEDDIALFRVGFVIAAGAEYNLSGNTSLVGSLRYNNGMFNIMKDPSSRFDKVTNHYVSLNVGILF